MKVTSVRIQNYKSFAEENNRIDLDTINTIIGKNESGKNNLIEAIGKLKLTGINDTSYFKNCNKNNNMSKPVISLVFLPYASEKNIYKSKKETIITINDQYDLNIEGGLTEIISNIFDFCQWGRSFLTSPYYIPIAYFFNIKKLVIAVL